jgi:hypothetical protein
MLASVEPADYIPVSGIEIKNLACGRWTNCPQNKLKNKNINTNAISVGIKSNVKENPSPF